jgi:hypothetical protein
MIPGEARPAVLLIAASLLCQSCVQQYPAGAYAPPPPAAPLPPAIPPQAADAADAQPAPDGAVAGRLPPGATDRLLGPIALYPDPLLALILPASTAPEDISAAAAYLVQYGDATRIDSQPWDSSVRALAHYPAIITWMAQNIQWTRAVGQAFLSSPADVMASIQRLRARALASGALASTPQQRVVVEAGAVEILPAQPDSVYAPAYDTDVVYSEEPYYGYGGPFMNFGDGLPVGFWLSYCIDWGAGSVWVGGRDVWHGPDGWHNPKFGGGHGPPGFRPWHPPDHRHGSAPPERGRQGESIPLPRPVAGAPNPPPTRYRSPGAQAGYQPGASGPGVPSPRTAAPPMDRPRLQYTAAQTRSAAGLAESEPRDPPTGEGAPKAQGTARAPSYSAAPEGAQTTAQETRAETVREAAPAPPRQSAPEPAHVSAPAPSHASSPAPPAPAQNADPKSH